MLKSLSYFRDWLDIRADANELIVGKMIATGGFKRVFEGTYDDDDDLFVESDEDTCGLPAGKRRFLSTVKIIISPGAGHEHNALITNSSPEKLQNGSVRLRFEILLGLL